jgi:hypothetical protein
MDYESYFTVDSKVIMSLKIPQQQWMSSLFVRPSSQVWLAVNETDISEPVFFKADLAVKKEVYISKYLPVLHKFIQKHHKNEKIVPWSNVASAHYVKDTLVQLEKLKIVYVPKEENPPNVLYRYGRSKIFGRT